ncbi:MAG: hypothetical protein ACYDAK_05590 [Candidatus Limnocylindrales bacterium]
MPETITEVLTARPGTITLRPGPAGLPAVDIDPPTIAESGDPFATARILHLVARLDRGRPIRLDDIVAALEGTYLDWIFDRRVVGDALLALQSNWRSDYRTAAGIELDEGPYGPTVTIEDSSRVDPWIVRQVEREVAACRAALTAFSRLDRVSGDA